jgi:hypothetical protein
MARKPRHSVALLVDGKAIQSLGERNLAILNALWMLMPMMDKIPAGGVIIEWQGGAVTTAKVQDWMPANYFTTAA